MNGLLNGIARALQLLVAIGIIVGFFTDFQTFLAVILIAAAFFILPRFIVWLNRDKE